MLSKYITKLMDKQNLSTEECGGAVSAILNGADSHQVAAFLVLLRAKRETADEIFGVVRVLREKMVRVFVGEPVLDIVGTGGDGANTVNISTGAALLAASCGVKVAKHGNRSVSSRCGSADVLEELGININLGPEQVAAAIDKFNFGFCFAPNYHSAMSCLRKVRKDLGVVTCFNILGPLLNPARAEYLMIGVFAKELVGLVADVLMQLKVKKALVFHGNGLDELSCIGPVEVVEVSANAKKTYVIDPQKYGFKKCCVSDLRGGDVKKNAQLLLDVFAGKGGLIADTIMLNAAVALYVYGKAASIEEAVTIVRENIFNGGTHNILEKLRRLRG
jgi:anthranilate phosphoribosyltransferase